MRKLIFRSAVVLLVALTSSHAFSQDAGTGGSSGENISSLYSRAGNPVGRINLGDGSESIDTFSGMLQYAYTDAVIPGDGGFDLPVMRRYTNVQYQNQDSTNRVFGQRWDIHFGRIKSNATNADLSQAFCPLELYQDANFAPAFQTPDGTTHPIYTVDSAYPGASNGITRELHRVTCNTDGTIEIETSSGMTYFFGKQRYLENGNGLQFPEALVNSEQRVEYKDYLYATRIEDRNGNAFDIDYTLVWSSNGLSNSPVFTIDSVRQGTRIAAEFTYDVAPGESANQISQTPNVILHQLKVGEKVLEYTYDSEFSGDTAKRLLLNNLIDVSITTGAAQGASQVDFSYEYYPAIEEDGVVVWQIDDANAGNLKTLTNRFGGTTTYGYQWIASPDGNSFNGVRAIASKTASGLGTWTYEFEQGAQSDGYDRTVVTGPENIRTQYTYCNMSLIDADCNDQIGHLVEKRVFGGNGTALREIETYQWRSISTALITNQSERIYAFGNYTPLNTVRFSIYPRKLVHTTATRGGDVLAVSQLSFDEFATSQVTLELRGNSPIPYGDYDGDGSIDATAGQALSVESDGNVNPLQSGTTIDADNPNVRVTVNQFLNITTSDTWIIGLQSYTSLYDETQVTSEPASASDKVITFEYDSKGNLTSRSDYGSSSRFEYDNNGNLTLSIDPNGNQQSFTDFQFGIAQSESRSLTLASALTPVVSRVVDPQTGYVSSFTVARDVSGGDANTTSLLYDRLGRITNVITPRPDDADITIIFNKNSTVTERGLRTTSETLDGFGRTTRSVLTGPGIRNSNDFDYDAYGRETYRSMPYEDDETPVATNYQYDALNRVVSETSSVDGLSTSYDYDGLVTTLTDRKGNDTVQTFRAFGSFDSAQLMSISQAVSNGANIDTEMSRTKTGQVLSVTQGDISRTFAYDGRYRVKRMTRPETADLVFSYDENGNKTSEQIVGLGATQYSYDGRDNLVFIDYPNTGLLNEGFPSESIAYQFYDDDLLQSSQKGSILRQYDYDESGNTIAEVIDVGGVGRYTIAREFDALDSLQSMVYPSGLAVDYDPDVLGRPTMVGDFLSLVDYSATGTINSAMYGNGLAWQMTQDEDNYIATNSVDTVFDEALRYDDNFNVATYESELNNNSRREYDYSYDGIDRVVSLQKASGSIGFFQYDDNSNLLLHPLQEIGDTDELYNAYDLTGNNASLDTIENIANFRFLFESTVENDRQGNISSYRDYSLFFDDAGLLRTLKKSGDDIASYEYDADGLRTIIDQDGKQVINLYSDGQLLHEVDTETGSSSDYLYLNKYLIAREDTLFDGVGSDVDSDGDGIRDVDESEGDADGDGISNQLDLDSDGDGIADSIELANDDDGDGVPNFLDTDSDNNGVLDLDENRVDQTHCSAYPNYSDELGLVMLSVTEGGVTQQSPYYELAIFQASGDLDNDGILNQNDPDIDGDSNPGSASAFGFNEWERNALYLADLDCDGVPNWYDVDSDGDTIIDSAELPFDSFADKDDDGDGIPNVYEADSDDNGEIDFKSLNTRLPYFDASLDENNNLRIEGSDDVKFGLFGQNFVLSSADLASIAAASEPLLTYRYTTERLVEVIPEASTNSASCNAGGGIFSAPVNFSGSGVSGTGTEIVAGSSIGYSEQSLQTAIDYMTRQFENQSNCLAASGITSPREAQYRPVTEIEIRQYQITDIPTDFSQDWIMQITQTDNTFFDRTGIVKFVEPYSGDGINIATGEPVVYTPLVVQYVSDPDFLPRVQGLVSCRGDSIGIDVELCTFSPAPNLNETAGKKHVAIFTDSDTVRGGVQIDFGYDSTYNLINWQSVYNGFGDLIYLPPGSAEEEPRQVQDFIFEISKPYDDDIFNRDTLVGSGDLRILAQQSDEDADRDGILDVIEVGNNLFPRDTDQDGVPDYLDLDSDNDRVPDQLEALFDASQPEDTDGDGVPDYLDTDSDGDGIPDGLETIGDADNDGIPNFQDTDSDGDRIPDSVEATSETALLDLDGDGIPNYLDEDADGDTLTDFYESGGVSRMPTDSDNDGMPDYLDTDSDNDGILDINELSGEGGGIDPNTGVDLDTDFDGLPDTYEAQFGLDINDASDAQSDTDADDLTAIDEFVLGTDPTVADSDLDGMPDGYEVLASTDPLTDDAAGDVDGDGVSNLDEYLLSIEPGEPMGPDDPNNPDGPSAVLVLDSVKDWGTGHIATYRYVLTESDIEQTSDIAWRIDAQYTGSGTVIGGWMSGYPGGTTNGNDPAFGGFYITNENSAHRPELSVGKELLVSFNVNGAGYDAGSYMPVFVNLGLEGEIETGGPDIPLPDNVTEVTVNDWYDSKYGSGGFNVTFNYEVTSADLANANNNPWLIDLGYTGTGEVTNAWVSSFPGKVNTTVTSSSSVEYSNFGERYRPTLVVGDVIRISVQINGAAYSASDFTFAFSQ